MKIVIDAGHGRYTAGRRCLKAFDPSETREWVLNDRIATQVTAHLQRCGADVIRVDDPSGASDVALATRVNRANAERCDYYISIHHNAGIYGGSGGGPVVFVYSGGHSAESDELQRDVYDGLISAVGKFGNRADPLAAGSLYVLRYTNMPAVLVEVGFMDSSVDVSLITDPAWAAKAAEGIARGICRTAGLTWVAETSFRPYLAKVTADSLNIRAEANASSAVTGKLVAGETVLIAEETVNGATHWGRLNLGLGWISLGYTE